MKNVALVAAHFPPSNLAGVHRARLWAQHLQEFGWRPTIVTTHWDFYEEKPDWDLHSLVSADLKVIRTKAIPTRPIRVFGELGIRAMPWHAGALSRLARAGEMDFLVVTLPSHFSALLGRWIHMRHGTPYGIDFTDPWIHHWPGTDIPFSKAWLSYQASRFLEPWAVKHASLITGVAPRYFEGVLVRNPALRRRAVIAAMPLGASSEDFELVRMRERETFVFDAGDDDVHLVYAGALLPKAYAVLERLLEAIALLAAQRPAAAERLRVHFIGTGRSPDDRDGFNVMPLARRHGVERWVTEHPARIGYVDVLNHLQKASAILVLGSTEPHYSPSKVFQSMQAGRPILALLHAESTAVAMLRNAPHAVVVTLTEHALPESADIASALEAVMWSSRRDLPAPGIPAEMTARESARVLAAAMDEALARQPRERP